MNPIKILMTAAVALVGLCCDANADTDPFETYLMFDAGVQRVQDMTLYNQQQTRISFDRGMRLDVRTGAYLNEFTGLELDFGLMHNRAKGVSDLQLTPDLEGMDNYQYTMMINAIGKVPIYGPLNIRGGIGFGIVYSSFWGRTGYNAFDATAALQAVAGIHYAITENYELAVTSKFLATTTHDLGSRGQGSGTRSYALMGTFAFTF